METIYIDRLFIINLLIDYLLSLGTARVCGLVFKRGRYFLAALFGAFYAALSVFPGCSFLFLSPLKLCSGIIMALIAFGGEKKFFRCAVVFFAVSALFGGVLWALSLHSGLGGSAVYIPLSMPVLAFAFGICYAVLSCAFSRTAKGMERQVYITRIRFNENEVTLRSLCDSGNALYDPVSGRRVLVASFDTLQPLFPQAALNIDASELAVKMPGVFRLIPYSAVGTSGGMLAAFRPQSISLDGKEYADILVAVSPQPITGDGFDSVIGI
ncbi:MAG: sigma-E processing peptidase SpoIIGA [Bacillota bacterium]|nr:sigma-E processing peptidase SpoIIGA [Bacillota bacterium]